MPLAYTAERGDRSAIKSYSVSTVDDPLRSLIISYEIMLLLIKRWINFNTIYSSKNQREKQSLKGKSVIFYFLLSKKISRFVYVVDNGVGKTFYRF